MSSKRAKKDIFLGQKETETCLKSVEYVEKFQIFDVPGGGNPK